MELNQISGEVVDAAPYECSGKSSFLIIQRFCVLFKRTSMFLKRDAEVLKR
jgi:hypothetical protein